MRKHPSSQNLTSAPFLKWIGGKSSLIHRIEPVLSSFGHRARLIEPFVGGASVFLQTTFDEYLLVDSNPHLIELYQSVQKNEETFIKKAEPLFSAYANSQEIYNTIRSAFNDESDALTRSAYFLYLNKFGYRGIVRYSSKGNFNTPFGHNRLPGFPKSEIHDFARKASSATFLCTDFTQAFSAVRPGDIVYCDPPYVDTDKAVSFRHYVPGGFSLERQAELANLAREAARHGIPVIISNHLTTESLDLYRGAVVHEIAVTRNLNPKAGLKRTTEGLFVFEPKKHQF